MASKANFNIRAVPATNIGNSTGVSVEVGNQTSCTKLRIVVVEVVFSKSPNQIYGYDENDPVKEDCYPSYKTSPQAGIPWKILESNKYDFLSVQISPIQAFSVVEFKSTSGLLTIQKPTITTTPLDIKLTSTGQDKDSTINSYVNGLKMDSPPLSVSPLTYRVC